MTFEQANGLFIQLELGLFIDLQNEWLNKLYLYRMSSVFSTLQLVLGTDAIL